MAAMRRSTFVPDRRFGRTSAAQRSKWLAAFDRSGLSAAAFVRQHGLQYTTFCGWRQRRTKSKSSPGFVQVELTPAPATTGLLIELGVQARMRVTSVDQIALAAQLIQHLNAKSSC
jgi:hypothetical protein